MAAFWTYVGTAVVSAGLNARSQQKQNRAIQQQISARQSILKKQINNTRLAHAVQTFSRYVSNAQAGAQRINQGLAMSGTTANARANNRLHNMIFNNDMRFAKFAVGKEIERVQDEINYLEMSRPPQRSFMSYFGQGLAGAAPEAVAYLPDKDSPKDKK